MRFTEFVYNKNMKLFLISLFFILNIESKEIIQGPWKVCKQDSDCILVKDLGCNSCCKSASINKIFSKDLNSSINKACADVFVPLCKCKKDYRDKSVKCLKNKCTVMVKHLCCSKSSKEVHLQNNCHIKKVNCRPTPIK